MACIFPTHLCKDNLGGIGLVVLSRNLSVEDKVKKVVCTILYQRLLPDDVTMGITVFYHSM